MYELQEADPKKVRLSNGEFRDGGEIAALTTSMLQIGPHGSPTVLGPQETVQLVTQRARAALNDQRETAQRALPHQQGEILAATHASSTART